MITGAACAACTVTPRGKLSEREDLFGNPVWDATRLKAQRRGEEVSQQGYFGPAMLPISELEYGAIRDVLAEPEKRLEER